MSYPFFSLAATSKTASQHPCRFSKAAAYKKTLDSNCEDYILCPFDTNYKACVSEDFCADYNLSSCPTGGNCTTCGKDNSLKYKLNSCNNGYTKSGNTCVVNSCPTGYSTAYQSVANCGTTGSKGWTFSSSGYSGNKVCGKCTAKSCCSRCATSIDLCGGNNSSGSKGWTFSLLSSSYSGDKRCGMCHKKDCPTGYNTQTTSCSSGQTLTTNGYSGNFPCGKCTKNLLTIHADITLTKTTTNGKTAVQCTTSGNTDSRYYFKLKIKNCNNAYNSSDTIDCGSKYGQGIDTCNLSGSSITVNSVSFFDYGTIRSCSNGSCAYNTENIASVTYTIRQ